MVLPDQFVNTFGFRAYLSDGTRFTDKEAYKAYLDKHHPEDVSLVPKPSMTKNLNECIIMRHIARQEFVLYFTETKLWCFSKVAKHLGFVERWDEDGDCWLHHPPSGTTKHLGHESLGFFATPSPPSIPTTTLSP